MREVTWGPAAASIFIAVAAGLFPANLAITAKRSAFSV